MAPATKKARLDANDGHSNHIEGLICEIQDIRFTPTDPATLVRPNDQIRAGLGLLGNFKEETSYVAAVMEDTEDLDIEDPQMLATDQREKQDILEINGRVFHTGEYFGDEWEAEIVSCSLYIYLAYTLNETRRKSSTASSRHSFQGCASNHTPGN